MFKNLNKKKYRISGKAFILILCLTLTLFASCKKTESKAAIRQPTPQPVRPVTVGFSIDTLAIERWQRDLDVFINKVKEMGADVIVQNAGNNIEEQNRQLMYLLERNVDCVVVLPKEADTISESVAKLRARGIPVISYDRLALNADVNLYLTIDSEKVGEQMAQEMLRRTKGQNWYCILGPAEDYNMTLIMDGVTRILRTTSVHINHIFYTDGWNYDLSYQEMVRILKNDTFPDAIICGNDAVAASVIQAINRYYPDTVIPVCGQDADISACQYIVQENRLLLFINRLFSLPKLLLNVPCSLPARKASQKTASESVQSITVTETFLQSGWNLPMLINTILIKLS